MTAPFFVTTEKKEKTTLPLLIVDKQGVLSRGLISVLSEHFPTVLVSSSKSLPHLSRIVHIPFRRAIPAIPDNAYSAIVIFYNGEKAIADGMQSFLKKAHQSQAKVLLITSRGHASAPFIKKALASYDAMHLGIYGDIFGISRTEASLVTHMLHEVHTTKRVSIHGAGLTETYPVYYADVLQGMLHLLLSHNPVKVGLLFPHHPVTEMTIARMLMKMYPQTEMQFVKGTFVEKAQALSLDGATLVENPYPLEDKLRHVRRNAVIVLNPTYVPKQVKKRLRDRTYLPYIGTTLVLFCLLSFATFGFFLAGLVSLKLTVNAGKSGDLTAVQARSVQAKELFRTAERTAGVVTSITSIIGLAEQGATYLDTLSTGKTVADIAHATADAGITYSAIMKGESLNPHEDMVQVASDLKQVLLETAKLQAEGNLPVVYQGELQAYAEPLKQVSGLIDVLPQLMGVGREQRYLVLFQNNMELRPGGGFIGSYGLLTLKDGAMAAFTVHDVYDADGQLTGHIDPPFGLRRYLGASHYFLRDSNFSIEFTENAALAASLLYASTGETVDGVVTLDVSFLRSLLGAIGPVYLPAFDETVTEKNFYLSVQSHAENDFFPGSSQKRDFLQHVAQALILSFEEREQLPFLSLIEAFSSGVNQKHIMITSANPELRTVFTKNAFSPTVEKLPEEEAATIADFLGVFDANVGLNKANYYIKRSIAQEVTLTETGERQGSVTIMYRNESNPGSPFGGDYKNYLQLVLPQDTALTGIQLNNQEQAVVQAVTSERVYTADGFSKPQGVEVETAEHFGRSVFGMFLEVPMGQELRVTVRYSVPQETPLTDTIPYVLRVYKQPGTDYDPYVLRLNYPSSMHLTSAPAFAGRPDQVVTVNLELSEDILLPLRFTR